MSDPVLKTNQRTGDQRWMVERTNQRTGEKRWFPADPPPEPPEVLTGGDGDAPQVHDMEFQTPLRVSAEAPPTSLEPGGTAYSAIRGVQRGMLGDNINAQIGAAGQVMTEYGKRGLAALGIGDAPPEHTFEEYLQSQLQADRLSDEHSPHAAAISKGMGMGATAILAPEVKVAQGANFATRAGAAAKNAALDASMGAAYAASESDAQDPANRMEDAVDGALWSGGTRLGLGALGELGGAVKRGVGHVGREVAKGAAVTQGGAGAARAVDDLLAPPKRVDVDSDGNPIEPFMIRPGAEARAAAVAGDEAVDELAPQVHGQLNAQQRLASTVMDQAGVRMKRGPVARDLAKSGRAPTQEVVTDFHTIANQINDLMANSPIGRDVRTGSGRNAKAHVGRGLLDAKEALGRIKESGPEASAEVFVIVDQLKRTIGQAAKKAMKGRGAGNHDEAMSEALWSQYEKIRKYLEDTGTWGSGPAGRQKRINTAWVDHLDEAQPEEWRALWSTSSERGADGVSYLKRAKPREVTRRLRGSGEFDSMYDDQALVEGSESLSRLTKVLAEEYELSPELLTEATRSLERAPMIRNAMTRTATDREAAGRLQSLREGNAPLLVPNVGNVVSGRAMGERSAGNLSDMMSRTDPTDINRSPIERFESGGRLQSELVTAGGALADTARSAAKAAPRIAALYQAGRQAYSADDMVQQMARTDDGKAQLGPYADIIAGAVAEDNFAVTHSLLQQTDPDYQQLLRELEGRAFNNTPARTGLEQEQ